MKRKKGGSSSSCSSSSDLPSLFILILLATLCSLRTLFCFIFASFFPFNRVPFFFVPKMVALSSSSSSSLPSPVMTDGDTSSSSTVDAILADPQRHFPRFLFESDPLAVMELLIALTFRSPERGHSAALECLWCWQDLTESDHSLSPLHDELRVTNQCAVADAAVRLLTRLLRFAPDRVTRVRLRNEMDELRFDELLLSLRDRFSSTDHINNRSTSPSAESVDPLNESIEEWMRVKAEATEEKQRCGGTQQQQDADSGTFSGEEEELRMMQKDQADGQLDELLHLARSLPANDVHLLVDALRNALSTNTEALLPALMSTFRTSNGHSKPNDGSQCAAPPPRPLPASSLPSPGAISVCSSASASSASCPPPAPPPPPPPLLFQPPPLMPPPRFGGPTPVAEIPRALRPKTLPDQCRRMRHLQWAKLPANVVATTGGGCASIGGNVWQTMEAVDREMRDRLDFSALDAFFGCPSSPPTGISDSFLPNSRRCPLPPSSAARRRSSMLPNGSDLVSLLGTRRSLSINIFLKMCRDSDQLLAELVAGKADQIGTDRLRTLAQLVPSEEEQMSLRNFPGDRATLGTAEQFILALISAVPDHRFRVEAMLFRADLAAMCAMNELLSSGTLRKVLYALLHLGNYLNHGAGNGNAVGFRLSSLWKVEDVKAVGSRGGRTLLHFVAQQLDNCADELGAELANVREAAKSFLEAISDDLRALAERMQRLEALAKAKTNGAGGAEDPFLRNFLQFLANSCPLITSAECQLAELNSMRRSLATFFCEQERNFSLEECFKVISAFVTRFEKAVEENRKLTTTDPWKERQPEVRKNVTDDVTDEMALKRMVKKSPWVEVTRRSFAAVVDGDRERTTMTMMPPSSPSSETKQRRRTAHSVTPLVEGRTFLKRLNEEGDGKEDREENQNERTREIASLEAVVDQALSEQRSMMKRSSSVKRSTEEKQMQDEGAEVIEEAERGMMTKKTNEAKVMEGRNGEDEKRSKGGRVAVRERIGQFGGSAPMEKTNDARGVLARSHQRNVPMGTTKTPKKEPNSSKNLPAVCRIRTMTSMEGNGGEQVRNKPMPTPEQPLRPSQVKAARKDEAAKMAKTKVPITATTTITPRGTMVQQRAKGSQQQRRTVPGAMKTTGTVREQVKGTCETAGTGKATTTPRPTRPTLIRQVSTSSRPALVHSVGGGRRNECEKTTARPKWI